MGLLDRWRARRDQAASPVRSSAPRGRDGEDKAPPAPHPQLPDAVFGVLALRTVGIAIDTARILEIAVVRCDATGAPLDTWARRFEPCVDAAAQDDHPRGRTPRRPDAGRPGAQIGTVLPELTARLAGLVLVAHGARVDLAVLRAELARAGWDLPWVPSLCTLEESWRHLPLLARPRLTDCWKRISGISTFSAAGGARSFCASCRTRRFPRPRIAPSA
ncbi:MAG: 3'-5' exonuclease [Cellulomonadaceae bacterium]|nr:3'-5' exonuclease [Cellulomonadaceae bacterium]